MAEELKMHGSSIRVAFVSMVALGLAGCGAFEQWACGEPCEAESTAADGSPSDFTLAEHSDAEATVGAVFECKEIGEFRSFAATVVTHGSDTDADRSEWIVDRLLPELRDRGLAVGHGGGDCPLSDMETGYAFIAHDWARVDPIVETMLEVAVQDDVAFELMVIVEPNIGACPDDACGA